MSAGMWHELMGVRWAYVSGTSGTPTLPVGASIIGIWAHASTSGASFTINGGSAILVPGSSSAPGEFSIRFPHLLVIAYTASALVFTNTDGYFVETILSGTPGY